LEIYAPLAGLIGMQNMREELEDLAFRELNSDARESIMNRLRFLREEGGDLVTRIADRLTKKLAEFGIEAEVRGREKRAYSIWRKMERKHISFEQLSDIIGFRVIVKSTEECYRALYVLHTTWRCVPERFKDFISTPKRNDYRSLHTTIVGPESQRVEVQIRTREMDEIAERGLAAHWAYKVASKEPSTDLLETTKAVRHLREIIESLETGATPTEFLENTKLEMFLDQVYCFTPRGDLVALPRGATPVDFAYAVHTEVGDTCVGCKINGQHMPLRSRLQNGDMVEIIRTKVHAPKPEWESYVVTGKARSAIRRFVRQSERDQFMQLGRDIARRAFQEYDQKFSEKAMEAALPRLRYSSLEDLYVAIGSGSLTMKALIQGVFPGIDVEEEAPGRPRTKKKAPVRRRGARPTPIAIRGLVPGLAVHMAKCCHPLPGDRIVGILMAGEGVTIHTIDCETLQQYNDVPDRWLDLSWNDTEEPGIVPVGRLKLIVTNERGTLGTLANIIAANNANISNLKITDRNPIYFEMVLDIEVADLKHLTQITAALRASPPVQSVERMRG
jgi:guanosine-3',5'-bis(diphosphate) 3'-pyrophosphohydrolase